MNSNGLMQLAGLAQGVICAVLARMIARRKNRQPGLPTFLGLFLGAIGLMIVVLMPSKATASPSSPVQTDPIVGEDVDAEEPCGHDLVTGKPLSDKKAAIAGVLQLFLGIFGAGRFYIASDVIGGCQLGLTIIAGVLGLVATSSDIATEMAGFLIIGVIVWAIIDAILMFIGSVTDGQGRKLR